MDELNPVADDSSKEPAVVAKEPKKKRNLADQDQQMQTDITSAAMMINNIETDNEILEKLDKATIDSEELVKGKTLQVAAQDSFTDRQNAIGTEQSAYTFLQTFWPSFIKEAGDFREIARARITDSGKRKALGLVGDFPQDRQRVITLLRASYTEAKNPEYQAVLGKAYSPTVLDGLLGKVQAAENAIVAARAATNAATHATKERNDAVKALRVWVGMVKKIAKRALRDRPDLLGKLGV